MANRNTENKKARQRLTPEQAADYLRQMADHLEQGQVVFGADSLELEGVVLVREKLKAKGHGAQLKLKLKLEVQDHSAQPAPRPRPAKAQAKPKSQAKPAKATAKPQAAAADQTEDYKGFKKDLNAALKQIKQAMDSGEAPDASRIKGFCDACDRLITFPGKGEANYQAFAQKISALRQAAQAGDPAAIKQALDQMRAMKSACHKQFK